MISDPYVLFECDTCGATVEVSLHLRYTGPMHTAPVYTMKGIEKDSDLDGWIIHVPSDTCTCADCAGEADGTDIGRDPTPYHHR